jgi:hypothetical protein
MVGWIRAGEEPALVRTRGGLQRLGQKKKPAAGLIYSRRQAASLNQIKFNEGTYRRIYLVNAIN